MRFTTALVSLALVAGFSSGAAAALPDASDPSSDRAQGVRISLSASPEWVRKGGIVTLSGRVKGVRGRVTVTIRQKRKGERRWVIEAVKRTTRKGRFIHREDVTSGDRTYRACVKSSCDSVFVHMGKQPAQATAVSITATSTTSVEAGQAFTVSGTASGNLNGRGVEIQAYDGSSGSWGAVGRATVQNGVWSAPTAVTTAGRAVSLRAVFLGGVGLASSNSTAISMAVYGWYYLYDGPPDEVATYTSPSYDSFNVNGTNYSKSVGLSGGTGYTSSVEYNVARSCIRLSATVGVNDEASTSLRTTGRVLVDSVTKWTKAGMGLGTSEAINLDISNGLRLRIENTETTDGSGYLVFGDARALCAF